MTDQQPDEASPQDQSEDREETGDREQSGGSGQGREAGEPGEVGDDQLPEDLQPAEDNPLARHPGQSGDEDDEIGADREEGAQTAPLTEEDSDYGGAGGSS